MSPTEQILAELLAIGARLVVQDFELRVKALKGTLTPDAVERIRAHKPELINLVVAGALEDEDDWMEEMRAAFAPIQHRPPAECLARAACGRLGPCDRHAADQPCLVPGGVGMSADVLGSGANGGR